jgi:hypothetical protein
MKTITIKDIQNLKPCYDPNKFLSENWAGTILDILDLKDVKVEEKFWVVLRPDFLDEKTLKLFAIKCCREIKYLIEDERSLKALDIAEAYILGKATKEELELARKEACISCNTANYNIYNSIYSAISTLYYTANIRSTVYYAANAILLNTVKNIDYDTYYDDIRNRQVEILKELILNG